MTTPVPWPSESDVRARWNALIEKKASREQVHDWTVPWVEGDWPSGPVPRRVLTALEELHGFTMAYDPQTPHLIHHGPPGVYVKTHQDIIDGFARWCAAMTLRPTMPQTALLGGHHDNLIVVLIDNATRVIRFDPFAGDVVRSENRQVAVHASQ